jgi:spoIIIJ-associated protein
VNGAEEIMAQRFEGRNLEEALNSAATTLGVGRWQLTYSVLLEKRGFLGGVKRVVVEAEINEAATQPAVAVAPPVAAVAATPSPSPAREPREGGGDRGARGGRGRGGRRDRGGDNRRGGGGGGRRGERRDDEDAFQPGDFEQFAAEVPEQGAESETAAEVRRWCEQVIALAKLELVVRTDENETQINVRLYGRDTRRLTDRHGELLDAIQVLANKALVGRKLEKDIELDTQEFKSKREEDLGQRARELADRVRRDGREQLLPAMSPIERRIVHLALQDDVEVATESRGEGFFKRVAIVPRTASEQTNSAS